MLKLIKIINIYLGALNETIKNDANSMMFYIGSPRKINNNLNINNFFIKEFKNLLIKNNILLKNIVIHSSYLINLANALNKNIFLNSINILKNEIINANKIGVEIIILHPGNSIGMPEKIALNKLIEGLNIVLNETKNIKIALETMSGKGTEIGYNFEQLKYIIDNIKIKERIGICWDTCHLHDSGYDLNNNLDSIINYFDKLIGLDKLFCFHINDSKNIINSKKDRHENIGYGHIGFNNLLKIIYHKKFNNKIKILETPFINKNIINNNNNSTYKNEIKMIKNKLFLNF